MIKKIKQLLTSLSLVGLLLAPALIPATLSAQSVDECLDSGGGGIEQCTNTGAEATDPNASTEEPSEKVNRMIRLIINIFSLIVGVIAVIMIIIGGLKYITSGGDSGNVTGAKNTILYAIIGLVIVALAQIIVRFVLTKVTTSG